MGIIAFIILAVILAAVFYFVSIQNWIHQTIKTIVLVAICIVLIVVLLQALGVFGIHDPQIPKLR